MLLSAGVEPSRSASPPAIRPISFTIWISGPFAPAIWPNSRSRFPSASINAGPNAAVVEVTTCSKIGTSVRNWAISGVAPLPVLIRSSAPAMSPMSPKVSSSGPFAFWK
jgi:hypothetical protein